MENLQHVADFLEERQLTLVTAESCTAGLVAGSLADMPGCGSWFKSGYITYSADAKQKILGVRPQTIEQFNLTSEEVAREMVEGALRISNADIAVANTGVAGPSNGDSDIPVGTVCFAWGFRRREGETILYSETRHFDGERNEVRRSAADHAIKRIPSLYDRLFNASD